MTDEAAVNSPEMHLGSAQATQTKQRPCDGCGQPFTPKRPWQHFHSGNCRNAFHTAKARKEKLRLTAQEKIRQAAPELFDALLTARTAMRGDALEHVWLNAPETPEVTLGSKIDLALAKAGWKPPKP